jgi:hypothetical protein
MRIPSREDRSPPRTAQGGGGEAIGEPGPSLLEPIPGLGHHIKCSVGPLVVRDDQQDVRMAVPFLGGGGGSLGLRPGPGPECEGPARRNGQRDRGGMVFRSQARSPLIGT